MKEFTINIHVNVGVTPALEGLLCRLLQPGENVVRLATVEREPISNASTEPVDAAPAEAQPVEAEQPAEQPAAAPDPSQPAYDDAWVRSVIDRTRQRIEGENYKQETTSERYKRYHRTLTGEFKRIATLIAEANNITAEKPTELPKELRKQFAEMCDELILNEDGEITTKVPF